MTSILQTPGTETDAFSMSLASSSSHPGFVGLNNTATLGENSRGFQNVWETGATQKKYKKHKHVVTAVAQRISGKDEYPIGIILKYVICCQWAKSAAVFSGWKAACPNGYWKMSTSLAGKWFPSWDFMEAVVGWGERCCEAGYMEQLYADMK